MSKRFQHNEILAKLRLLGVDYGQGYGISKLVPLHTLINMQTNNVSIG